jgi:hypothetical protein
MSRQILSPHFLISTVKNVEKQIRRDVTSKEEDLIISYIKSMPKTNLRNIPLERLMSVVTDSVIEEMHLKHCEDNVVDVHELLKDNLHNITVDKEAIHKHNDKVENGKILDVHLESAFGFHNIADIVKKVNEPVSSVNKAYFILDTRYRELSNDGTRFFKWGHINSLVRSQGTFNSVGNIRDIITVKLMPYRIPAVASAVTPYGRVSTFIKELCPQSYIAHEDARFHFIGNTEALPDNWLLVDSHDFNNGEFNFNKPITHLDSITLSLGSPLEPIIFDKDRLPGTITSFANPTIIDFMENHNIITGNIVYITTFSTQNPGRDTIIINGINNNSGNTATVINPTRISIPIDTSTMVFTLAGTVTAPSLLLGGTVSVMVSNVITGAGTAFIADFVVGDYIEIQNGTDSPIFQIIEIISNTRLIIDAVYSSSIGTFAYRRTGVNVTGAGTAFTSELSAGDNIIIQDGGNTPSFTVSSIQNDTELTLESPYNGADGAGFMVDKDNSINRSHIVFFGSKRIFIPINVTYLSS